MKGVPGLPPPPDSGFFCSPRRLQGLNPQSQERAGAQFQDPSRRAQSPLLPGLRGGTGEAGPGPTHHPTPPPLPAPPPASGSALHPWLEEAGLWATVLGCFCLPCSLFPADVAKAVELLGPLLPAFQGQALDVARDSWAGAQDTSVAIPSSCQRSLCCQPRTDPAWPGCLAVWTEAGQFPIPTVLPEKASVWLNLIIRSQFLA